MGRVDIYPTTALQGPPSAQLGYAEVTADQNTITTVTDLTGLAITVTVPVGRRIRIVGKIAVKGSIASNTGALQIQEGATVFQNIQIQNSTTAGNGTTFEGSVIITPSAGTHTYKLTLQTSAGGGNVSMVASSLVPAFILVEDITGTFWNGVPVTNPPTCRLFHNATQSIADNTETTLAFNSELFDTDTMHSTSVNTERITFNTAGVYIVTVTFGLASATDYTSIYGAIRLNGTTIISYQTDEQTEQAQTPFINLTTIYKFAATDYVEARVFQNNTANVARNVLGASSTTDCVMGAAWIALG